MAKTNFASVFHLDRLEVFTTIICVIADLFQCLRKYYSLDFKALKLVFKRFKAFVQDNRFQRCTIECAFAHSRDSFWEGNRLAI